MTDTTRLQVQRLLQRDMTTNFMAFLILVDFVMTVVDIDARAVGPEASAPMWSFVISEACLAVYTVELALVLWLRTDGGYPWEGWVLGGWDLGVLGVEHVRPMKTTGGRPRAKFDSDGRRSINPKNAAVRGALCGGKVECWLYLIHGRPLTNKTRVGLAAQEMAGLAR